MNESSAGMKVSDQILNTNYFHKCQEKFSEGYFFQNQEFFLHSRKVWLIEKCTQHAFADTNRLEGTLQFVYYLVCISNIKLIESREESFVCSKQV